MDRPNPYDAPRTDTQPADTQPADVEAETDFADKDFVVTTSEPRYSTAGTVVPRVIAATVDNLLTFLPGTIVAVRISESSPILAMIALVVIVLGYFVLFEGLFSRTPGKFFTGLVVTGYDGSRCTWWQAVIRSGARLIEVNPLLFGAIPAALCIIISREHRRIGDIFADTVVVRKESVDW